MGISVYKAGVSHVENGIKCEIKTVEASALESALAEGWKLRVEDCYAIPSRVKNRFKLIWNGFLDSLRVS